MEPAWEVLAPPQTLCLEQAPMVAFPHRVLSPLPGLEPLTRVAPQNPLGCKIPVLVDASWIQGEFKGSGRGGGGQGERHSSSPHPEEPTSVHPTSALTPLCKRSPVGTSHPKKAPAVGPTVVGSAPR